MRILRLSLLSILFLSIASFSAHPEPVFRSADELLVHWEEAIRDRNPELFAACYWPDARKLRVDFDGNIEDIEGRDRITERQEHVFRELGRELEAFHLPEPERYYDTHAGMPRFIFREPEFPAIEMFQFQERRGEWRVLEHRIYERYGEGAEVGPLQEPFDHNRNGILEPHEQAGIFEAFLLVCGEHEVLTPIDELMDTNGDGFLDEEEAHRARLFLIRDRLRYMPVFAPEFTRRYLDSDRDGSVGVHEADIAVFDFVLSPERSEPIPVEIREFSVADFDEDMWISRDEIQAYRELVLRMAAVLPEPVGELREMEGSPEEIALWSDGNRDGRISDGEMRDIGMLFLRSLRHEDIVSSPLVIRYDSDRNLILSEGERENMRGDLVSRILPRASEEYLPEYPGLGIMDFDGREGIGPVEIEEAVEVFSRIGELIGTRPNSRFERHLDRDPENGNLEEWELFEPLGDLQAAIGRCVLEDEAAGPGEDPEKAIQEDSREVVPSIEPVREPREQADGREEITVDVDIDPVFPVLFKYYDTASVGTAVVSNTGGTPVTDVVVKLDMDRYIDSPRESGTISSLEPGEKKELDLLALFNEQAVLAITEGTKAAAQILIEYTAGGEARRVTVTQTMEFYDRNALRWDDDRKAAAFITARDNGIQLFAKNMNAALRDRKRTALSGNLQLGMILFAAMKIHGLAYSVDPGSSYAVLSEDGASVDYLQFPSQTLAFKSGDCDDLSVCYAALLEAVGVDTALVTVPGHIFPAFALDLSEADARKSFLYPEDLIYGKDGKVWMPVEATLLTGSFLEAWTSAAKQWREYSGKGTAKLHPTAECWKIYSPVGFAGNGTAPAPPESGKVTAAFESDIDRFVRREIAQRELTLLARLEEKPSDAATLNRLGTLYARYGLTEKAEERFKAAVGAEEYFPALLNIGHVEFMDGKYSQALGHYDRALTIKPNSPTAVLAAARANYELQNYGNVRSNYERLKTLSPSLALQFSYLDLQGSDTRRAADAMRLKSTILWEDEETEGE